MDTDSDSEEQTVPAPKKSRISDVADKRDADRKRKREKKQKDNDKAKDGGKKHAGDLFALFKRAKTLPSAQTLASSQAVPQSISSPVIQLPQGQGALLWNLDWQVGREWLSYVHDGKGALCVWCKDVLKTGSWATTGCFTRKLAAVLAHEDSADHQIVAVKFRQSTAMDLLISKDQQKFDAFQTNFDILYFMLRNRVLHWMFV
jgi:hypothetical protein